jgi:hypothetical protein
MASQSPAVVAVLSFVGLSLAWWLLMPLSVLAHELGHAAVALALTDGRPSVQIGVDPDRSVTLGRLTLRVDPRAWRQQWYGYCRYGATPDGRFGRAALSLAGPVASGLVLAAAAAGTTWAEGLARYTLVGLGFWTGAQLVVTLAPVTYPEWMGAYAGLDSDGKQAMEALRGRR